MDKMERALTEMSAELYRLEDLLIQLGDVPTELRRPVQVKIPKYVRVKVKLPVKQQVDDLRRRLDDLSSGLEEWRKYEPTSGRGSY